MTAGTAGDRLSGKRGAGAEGQTESDRSDRNTRGISSDRGYYPEITTPDTVETRLGTLNFKWGMPDQESIQKVYDNIDFTRAETTMRLNHGSVLLEGPFD